MHPVAEAGVADRRVLDRLLAEQAMIAGDQLRLLVVPGQALLDPPARERAHLLPPLGIVANSGVTIALWRLPQLSEQMELATMLWSTTVVLFNTLLVLYGVGVGGFSLAGRASGRMPRWVWILGVTFGAIGIATGAGVGAVVTRAWAAGLVYFAFALLLVWVAATSVLLLRAGRRP